MKIEEVQESKDVDATTRVSLNVGCGRRILPKAEGWINIDSQNLDGVDIVFDLETCDTNKLPLEDNSVDLIFLSHVLEHIRNVLPLAQELHRVAKPGAEMIVKCPHGGSDDAWGDPTHVRAYFADSFMYFSQHAYHRADYGYRGDWEPEVVHYLTFPTAPSDNEELLRAIQHDRNSVREIDARLRCVKPIRKPDATLLKAVPLRILRPSDLEKLRETTKNDDGETKNDDDGETKNDDDDETKNDDETKS